MKLVPTIKIILSILFWIAIMFISSSFVKKTDVQTQLVSLNQPINAFDQQWYDEKSSAWVDSIMNVLSPEERVAQLFMVAAYSNKDQAHVNEILKLVSEQKIGGLIFFQGGPVRQAKLTNLYQSKAKVPLMISIDGEWGLSMRLDSTVKYPRQMMLGAIQDNNLIYKMGQDIAEQCKRIGIHVNLAPVADINSNPKNPVINSRSFGEDKENVTKKCIAYMKGMQDNKVMANAKHFPGHGDTDTDSHLDLPIVKHTQKRISEVELYPFRELIKEGIGSIMVAHLYIPSIDSTKNQASTLSPKVVNGLLKKDLGFKGLVFTDALNMKGVSKFFKPGYVDVKALLAGNDVLLFSEDVPTALSEIKKAIEKGEITQKDIDERCRRILMAKQWCGLNKYQPIKLENLYKDLNQTKYEVTNKKLVESAITVLRNQNNMLPLKKLDSLKIATVAIGEGGKNDFQRMMDNYTKVSHFQISKTPTQIELNGLLSKLEPFNLVVVSIHNTSETPSKNFGIPQETIALVNKIKEKKKIVLDVFANPYSLAKFTGSETFDALVVSYNDSKYAQEMSAMVLFGGIKSSGKLPISASPLYPVNAGFETASAVRFKYGTPEDIGINSADLIGIETIIKQGIEEKAFPGCQVFVSKDGVVIYNKSFGCHTYENVTPVLNDDVYDLASITKIGASTVSLMRLVDEKKIHLDSSMHHFFNGLVDTTMYKTLTLREMLAHQAGLVSWIPFYQSTVKKGVFNKKVYRTEQTDSFNIQVAENLYISKFYQDDMMRRILGTPLKDRGHYKYSDLGYYFFKKIIENETGSSLDVYTMNTFYAPLGMTTAGYKPRERHPLEKIAPTEYDLMFRKQLVHGHVHDPGAAMMGGIGGHAGLFANANDLAKLMQMLVNKGEYGGERYLSEEVVHEFTKCQFCKGEAGDNRRGAGFDKPVSGGGGGPTCDCVSYESFGHSGFTGTLTWADPDQNVVFVFLSNRVYPDADNTKLLKGGHRTKIMQVVYDAIANQKKLS